MLKNIQKPKNNGFELKYYILIKQIPKILNWFGTFYIDPKFVVQKWNRILKMKGKGGYMAVNGAL